MRKVALALFVPLVACVSPTEIRMHDQQACAAYGFQAGTDGFASCMQRRDQMRAAAMSALGSDMEAQGNALMLSSQLQIMNTNLSRIR